ncbi:DUF262 domain-containing protein [Thiohalorhabdus methylotrophus]|uniref:DUF262 domain-containing protein n=1 Tax=Thiohalorhabdus methylotrophus TaxID=3242694 RepID=A0ABV4TQB2_9GAMM
MRPAQVRQIFDANAQTVSEFLKTEGLGLFIPSYQRPYSWDQENIKRLFEDISYEANQIADGKVGLKFLGSVITIRVQDNRAIPAHQRLEAPGQVMSIIDGQQRLSTLLLINLILHDLIRKKMSSIASEEILGDWILRAAREELSTLKRTLILDKEWAEDEIYRYYPRVIREIEDLWALERDYAKYRSPIASLIFNYVQELEGENRDFFDVYEYWGDDLEDKYKNIADNISIIKGIVRDVLEDNNEDYSLPNLEDFVFQGDGQVAENFFGLDVPEGVEDYFDRAPEGEKKEFRKMYKALMLSKLFNNSIAFTVVVTEIEDYAFDIFEALNTTGEPLTAYETFKPKVINEEGQLEYKHSPSKNALDWIEKYIDSFDSSNAKQKATTDLMIAFRLSWEGKRLSSHLNQQRKFLKSSYENRGTLEGKRGFVFELARTSDYIRNCWNPPKGKVPCLPETGDPQKRKEALFCIEFLRNLKHDITIGPLSRFYAKFLLSETESKYNSASEFFDAIKAVAAFSAIWRAAHSNTAQIDKQYRDLMEKGISEVVSPLSAINVSPTEINIEDFKFALINLLHKKGSLDDKEIWVEKVKRNKIYKASQAVTRFILLTAGHDSIVDEGKPHLITKGRKGVFDWINIETWKNEEFLTVEHIAPQNNNGSWGSLIYSDEAENRLGNLTLLPARANSIASDRAWPEKRRIYGLYGSLKEEEAESWIEEIKLNGMTLSEDPSEISEFGRYLATCRSLSRVEGEWGVEIINERSERLAELAWEQVFQWLT